MEIVQNFDRKDRKWRLELMSQGNILPTRPWWRHPINALCFIILSLVTPWEKVDTWVLLGGVWAVLFVVMMTVGERTVESEVVSMWSKGHTFMAVTIVILTALLAVILMVSIAMGAVVLVLVALLLGPAGAAIARRFEWQNQSFFHRRDHLDVAYGAFAVGSFLFLVGPQGQTTGLHVIGVMLILIAAQQFFHPLRFRVDSQPSLWAGRILCTLSLGCMGLSRSR